MEVTSDAPALALPPPLTATALGAPVYRKLGFERFSSRARYTF